MYKILFVCTGNICRSPLAEGVLRRKLQDAGLSDKVGVASAGTHKYHIGEAPDWRSVKVAKAGCYDISAQRAQHFTVNDYDEFDLILGMDESHMKVIRPRMFDKPKGEVALFLEYAGMGKIDVKDPYYGEYDGFVEMLRIIEAAADRLVAKLLATFK